MNSNNDSHALLDIILARLDESIFSQKIDIPLELAFHSFAYEIPGPIDRQQFKHILTMFYQHISRVGLNEAVKLTEQQAFQEVVWILEKYYRGINTHGYDGAHDDAFTYGREGIELILESLFGVIKSIEREKYISWIVHTTLDPSDWFAKKKLVEDILVRYGNIFSGELVRLSPAQLIPHLEDLLLIITSALPA